MAPRTKKPAPESAAPAEPTTLPATPGVSDEARQGIQTITTQLAEFDKVEAGLQELEKTYANVVYDCASSKGMKEAVAARQAINKPRFAVEHARKAAKDPLVKLGRDIDGRAKVITERLLAIEKPIDDQIKAAEQAEAERKKKHVDALEDIRNTPDKAIGKSIGDLEILVESLNNMPVDAFEEFKDQATRARDAALSKVELLLANARQAEELQQMRKREADEKARKDAIQARIDEIRALLTTAGMARTAARVAPLLERAKVVVIDDTFAELRQSAEDAKAAVVAGLQKLHDDKLRTEQEAAQAQADAAAAAVAAPAPAPAPAPTPAPAPVATPAVAVHSNGAPMYSTTTFKENGDPIMLDSNGKRSIFCDIADDPEPDPFTAPIAAPAAAIATSTTTAIAADRPTDAEILGVLVDHYDSDPQTVAGWLAKFDARTALAQQSLAV